MLAGSASHNLPTRQILDPSKLKEFADDNFECDENGRKFSKQIENSVGKREIARYEQFLLFPQGFQKTCIAGLVWERVKMHLDLDHTVRKYEEYYDNLSFRP